MKEILYLLNPWWENKLEKTGIYRKKYLRKFIPLLKTKDILLILGSRRVGKTTILYQLIKKLIESKFNTQKVLYISLDHPVFIGKDIFYIINEYRKIFAFNRDEKIYLFLDEIQYLPKWEKYVKSLYDFENIKIIISGSSTNIISKQSTALTGRSLKYEIKPLDFKEFLEFKNYHIGKTENYKYENYLLEYLQKGGYPEYVIKEQPNYLTQLLENVIFRDIIYYHQVRNPRLIENLILLLAERISSRTSLNKLRNILQISLDSVREYLFFLRESYLIEELRKFSYSLNEQIYNEKKYYFLDPGLRTNLVGFKDTGRLVENAVFTALSERFDEVYYFHKEALEVDFIIKIKNKLIPVESKFTDQDIQDAKQYSGLRLFLKKYKPARAFIITKNLKKQTKLNSCDINFIPAYDFLLNIDQIFR